jgi:hypothetical protein
MTVLLRLDLFHLQIDLCEYVHRQRVAGQLDPACNEFFLFLCLLNFIKILLFRNDLVFCFFQPVHIC